MALNKALVGKTYPPNSATVELQALQKYAEACDDRNPFYFDPASPGGIIAPPMFGVVIAWPSILCAVTDSEMGVDLIRLLHAEQEMEFRAPLHPGDRVESIASVVSVETKATGESLLIEVRVRPFGEPGEILVSRFGAFIRGRGAGRGGAGEPPAEPVLDASPVQWTQTIAPDQTFRYAEASGDYNPIHTDERTARMAGLPGIIVHGLCTMAFIAKGLVDHLGAGDPRRLRYLRVRFAAPVFPGETLTTRVALLGERDGAQSYVLDTLNPAGRKVIRDASAELRT